MVLGLIGIVISVLSLILGFTFFLLSRRDYKVCFQTSTLKLIGGALPNNISIQVDGDEQISRLSKTTVRIWNSGRKALTQDKVAKLTKIHFDKGDWIIDAEIVKESDSTIQGILTTIDNQDSIESNEILIRFSDLDRKDEIVIDMYHDSELQRPYLDGRILEHKSLGPIDRGEIGVKSKWAKFVEQAVVFGVFTSVASVLILIFIFFLRALLFLTFPSKILTHPTAQRSTRPMGNKAIRSGNGVR